MSRSKKPRRYDVPNATVQEAERMLKALKQRHPKLAAWVKKSTTDRKSRILH